VDSRAPPPTTQCWHICSARRERARADFSSRRLGVEGIADLLTASRLVPGRADEVLIVWDGLG
jgi:hypothetical protein